MTKFAKYLIAGLAVACATAFGTLGSAAPAAATGWDCDHFTSSDALVGIVQCFDLPAGRNIYRAKVTCAGIGGTRTIYGPWVTKGTRSAARCSSDGSYGVTSVVAQASTAT
ncbi:hypothetical protein ILP97_37815 [Amycolatopsis sp. H6(2020)]|nr:hypothetical protein [Amycolatopsis sp. H6(2020)]